MRTTLAVLLAASALMTVAPEAFANEPCKQNHSTYQDADSGAELAFSPNAYGAETYFLAQLRLASGEIFNGEIVWGNGYSVPQGAMAGPDCADTANPSCVVWEAVVYQLTPDNRIDYIGTGEAARQVLLPDVSRQLFLAARSIGADWDAPVGDSFDLVGCTGG